MTAWVLGTGSANGRSPALNAERLINLCVERTEQESKGPAPIFQAPGLTAMIVAGAGPIRGIWYVGIFTYVVSGTELYRINFDNTVTLLGTGIAGAYPLTMSDNGVQICIVAGRDGGAGYIYDLGTGVFGAITSPNYFPSYGVIYFDGYFLFNRQFSNQVFYSALFDGTTFNGTDFFSTESSSTYVLAMASNLQLLFFFKADSIEIWYDAGQASNPFQRYAGGIISVGCAAWMGCVKQDQALFFVGNDGVIYRLQANTPVRVSTHAIETILAGEAPNLANVLPFSFTCEGHKFVVFMLPQQNRTIVFDIASGKWHERESYDSFGTSVGMWRVTAGRDAQAGVAVLGDRLSGQLWKASFQAYTEGAYPLYCSIISAPLAKDRKRLTINQFEIDMQTDVGGSFATLYTSKDNADSFQSRGSAVIPTNAAQDKNMRWFKLGSAKQWTFKLTFNSPTQRVLLGAFFDVTEGM